MHPQGAWWYMHGHVQRLPDLLWRNGQVRNVVPFLSLLYNVVHVQRGIHVCMYVCMYIYTYIHDANTDVRFNILFNTRGHHQVLLGKPRAYTRART